MQRSALYSEILYQQDLDKTLEQTQLQSWQKNLLRKSRGLFLPAHSEEHALCYPFLHDWLEQTRSYGELLLFTTSKDLPQGSLFENPFKKWTFPWGTINCKTADPENISQDSLKIFQTDHIFESFLGQYMQLFVKEIPHLFILGKGHKQNLVLLEKLFEKYSQSRWLVLGYTTSPQDAKKAEENHQMLSSLLLTHRPQASLLEAWHHQKISTESVYIMTALLRQNTHAQPLNQARSWGIPTHSFWSQLWAFVNEER